MNREKIENSISQLDAKLEKLINNLQSYDTEALNYSPSQERWSPTQIMNHLILAEKLSLDYCRKKLSFKPDLAKAGMMSAIRTTMIRAYLFSPLKIKAPAFISTPVLPTEDTLEHISKSWWKVRKELKIFIQEVPMKYIDKEVYKHPFGGRLSLLGMIKVMDAHFENHRRQIIKILNS